MGPIALYLDENVSLQVAVRLTSDGFDVLAARDAAMLGRSDEDQLAFAADQERAIFTHDFRDLDPIAREWDAAGRDHWGIIYGRIEPADVICEKLRALCGDYPEGLRGCTVWLPPLPS